MTSGRGTWLGTAILLLAVLTPPTQNAAQECSVKQSPRDIQANPFPGPYNGTPPDRPYSFVTDIDGAKTIKYKGQTLYRCDQHYHVPVENTQGCKDERSGTPPPDGPPPEEQWVEIHTVYSPEIRNDPERCKDPVDQNLYCCVGEPVVVRGFSAKVEHTSGDKSSAGPMIPANGRPLAEWTGSNTGGAACPGDCKPVKAEWSSLVTCEITVTQDQLKPLGHAHEARCPQPQDRLSNDLTLAGTPPPVPTSCHLVRVTTIISTDKQAKAECPRACTPGTRWEGQWITWNGGSECGCCASPGR